MLLKVDHSGDCKNESQKKSPGLIEEEKVGAAKIDEDEFDEELDSFDREYQLYRREKKQKNGGDYELGDFEIEYEQYKKDQVQKKVDASKDINED